MLISFKVTGLPVSYNKHFQIIWSLKQCQLSPEAHAYKNRVKLSIPPVEIDDDKSLSIEVDYHYNFYYKNGKLKKIDSANCDKILYDAISERLGIDDSLFKTRLVHDYHNEKESFVEVRIDKIE